MSRVGRSPIPLPSGVEVDIQGRRVTVKGPKGTLVRDLPGEITVRRDDGALLVEHREALDVALALEDRRQRLLQLRRRHADDVVHGDVGVADAGVHVRDRIGHRQRARPLTSWPS